MATADPQTQIEAHLRALGEGDDSAFERLLPLIYDDLRALARRIQGPGAAQHSLNPTALVHEAYGRLVRTSASPYDGRRHFMGVAAKAMRQLLSNHARDRRRLKRGGDGVRVTLVPELATEEAAEFDVVALDDALSALSERFPRQGRVVELRYLAGLSVEETAEVLGVSARTAKLDWQLAKAWLKRALSGEE